MKKIAAWIALGIITIVAGLLLSMTNEVTKDVIATQEAEARIQARKDVLPDAESFEVVEVDDLAPLSELFAGIKNGEPVGYVGTVSVKGYGGPIQVIAGVDSAGKVTGVSVGGADFAETAGLGAKARDAAFTGQFIMKQTPVKSVKNARDRGDNTVDSIAAATITTNAVTSGVNNIAGKVDNYLNPPTDTVAEGVTYTASQQGFAGPVTVFVTVKDDGTISALKVGDDAFAETEGFGAAALEDSFTKTFVSKALPLTGDEVDGISGATITTDAVVAAINKAFEDKVVVAPAAPEGTAYTASEQGFAGPVAVFVIAKDDGTITALRVGDDAFKETEGFGAPAKEQAFTAQFVGKTIPLAIDDIDALSGATVTTNAVVAAINRAFEEKLVDESVPAAAEEPTAIEAVEATDMPAEEPAETSVPEVAEEPIETELEQLFPTAPPMTGRSLLGTAQGHEGLVRVVVSLRADNTISKVVVLDDGFIETPGIGDRVLAEDFLNAFVGKRVPLAAGAVDTIGGATVTSQAVMAAVNQAIEQLMAEPAAVPVDVPEVLTEQTEAPAEEQVVSGATSQAAPMSGRAVLGTGEGYGGPVNVVVVLNADDTIASVAVITEGFAETAGIGDRVLETEYLDSFKGMQLPLAEGDHDAIGGATVSSQAVTEAINRAFARLNAETAPDAPAAEAPIQNVMAASAALATTKGFIGPITVVVTLNADNTIASVVVLDSDFQETPGIGDKVLSSDFLDAFSGKTAPLGAGAVDTIGGSTVSSQAVIDAVNEAVAILLAQPEVAK